jgi:hypothetical protein
LHGERLTHGGLDSGWGDWAPAWSKVQPEIAKWTRACSYERAGIGGPYILVGSAFGGDNVRTFADRYMDGT